MAVYPVTAYPESLAYQATAFQVAKALAFHILQPYLATVTVASPVQPYQAIVVVAFHIHSYQATAARAYLGA